MVKEEPLCQSLSGLTRSGAAPLRFQCPGVSSAGALPQFARQAAIGARHDPPCGGGPGLGLGRGSFVSFPPRAILQRRAFKSKVVLVAAKVAAALQ